MCKNSHQIPIIRAETARKECPYMAQNDRDLSVFKGFWQDFSIHPDEKKGI